MNDTSSTHSSRTSPRRFSLARGLTAVLALAALAVSPRSLAQAPTFNTLVNTSTNSEPWNPPRPAAVGDFNGDGKLDALIVDGSARARFMRGNGDGTFAEINLDAAQMTVGNMTGLPATLAQYMPQSIDGYVLVRAADVNGDGKLDAVCATTVHINFAPYSLATVLINTGNDANGAPQFTTTHYFLGFYDVRSLTAGDLNGDGKPDFIIGSAYGGQYVHRNNGNGTFTVSQVTTLMPNVGGATGPGVIADVNGDGKADYVVTSNQANATDIFLGNGDGTFQTATPLQNFSVGVAVADVNGDGKPDILTTDITNAETAGLWVYLNVGGGAFGAPTKYPLLGASSVAVADINGDGILDAVVGDISFKFIAVMLGNGSGGFGAPTNFATPQNPVDVTVADFNGDGKLDIATVQPGGYGGQYFGVLTNTTPVPVPATLFFTDALTGPSSPNLAAIPTGKYGYTAAGLQRTQSSSTTDRPMVSTALSTYLATTTGNFGADITVKLSSPDLLYFGLGQGDVDANYFAEPDHAFYFRVHSNWQGNNSIQGDVRSHDFLAIRDESVFGYYTAGSTITLRITKVGDTITMAVVGGVSTTYSLSAYQTALGLNTANTRLFFGNTSVGTVFSNLKVYALPSDTTAPVITAPANIITEATSAAGAAVTFTATATDDVDGAVNVVASRASGSTFPIATTPVGLAAADKAGNTATASFTVTVKDSTPPTIGTAPTVAPAEATGPGGAVVTFTLPSATDIVDGNTAVIATPASGSTFALGNTTVTLKSTDSRGNSASKSFTVSVQDTTAPTIGAAPTVAPAEATSPGGAVVTFTLPTATDLVDGNTAVIATPASGSTFALGNTTVTLKSTDSRGNIASKSFTVTVQDTTAPVITVPANITVEATSATGAIATYPAASATDAVGPVTLTYSKASGTAFALGATTVTVTAKDGAGNVSTKNFTVTVKDSIAPAITATMTPRGGGDDESAQFFTLAFSATDAVGVKTLTAVLNGVTVTNGQIVQLQTIKSGAQSVKRDDGKLQIKATSFALVVTSTDAAGNTSTKTVVPVFVKNGKNDDDKNNGKDRDDDKRGS